MTPAGSRAVLAGAAAGGGVTPGDGGWAIERGGALAGTVPAGGGGATELGGALAPATLWATGFGCAVAESSGPRPQRNHVAEAATSTRQVPPTIPPTQSRM